LNLESVAMALTHWWTKTKAHPGLSVGYDVTAVLSEVEAVLCNDP